MSYVYNNKAVYYYNMFYGCKNLEEIFLPNFQKRSYSSNYNMFIEKCCQSYRAMFVVYELNIPDPRMNASVSHQIMR